MNDTKFLGLCILLAALMISATIIWSTKANLDAMTPGSPSTPVSVATAPTSVTISGPVQIAPFPGPIPVTLATPNDTPILVKDVTEKQWTR